MRTRFDRGPIGTQWASLYAAFFEWGALNLGSIHHNLWLTRLARFMRWCASTGIPAEFVDDRVIARYLRDAPGVTTKISAYVRERDLRSTWNYAVGVVPGWPAAWVTLLTPQTDQPRIQRQIIVSFPEREFLPSLVAEVDLYCKTGGLLDAERNSLSSLTHRDRMAVRLDKLKDAPPTTLFRVFERRPQRLRPDTIYGHKRLIYRTATALYLAGAASIEDLRSIRDVITPQGAAILIDSLQERHADNSYLAGSIMRFSHIARRCGIELSSAEFLVLRELWLDICPDVARQYELSTRSLRRLLQFDDPDKFAMLIALPDVLMREAEDARRRNGGWATPYWARQVRAAIVIEILNTLPVRRASLLSIDIERNIIQQRGLSPLLIFYPDQVKTRRALEVRLSQRTWRLISIYCKHYRPSLRGADQSTLLIPGQWTKGPSVESFARTVCKIVQRRVGVTVNLNLWRHLLGTKVAEMREQTEDAGRLLGHVPGSPSTGKYVRVGTRIAAKWLGQITDEVRPRGMELLTGRRASRRQSREPRK
jgi:hypothetical protein